MFGKVKATMMVAVFSLFISSCYSGLDNLFTVYDVQAPVADELNTDLNALSISILKPSDRPTPIVYLNGGNISECFNYADNPITTTYPTCEAMWDYTHEGENTLSVDPDSLFGGTTITFYVNMEGPKTSITNVCYHASGDCSLSDTGNVSFDVWFVSPVDVVSNSVSVTGSSVADGTVFFPHTTNDDVSSYTIPVSDFYTFTAEDSNGNVSSHQYQRDGMMVEDIVNLRIDETMLGEFKDLLGEGISDTETDDPLDGDALDGPAGTKIYINRLEIGKATIRDIYITDESGTDADLAIDMIFEPFGDYTIDGSPDNIDDLGMYVDLTVKLDLCILWCVPILDLNMPMWVERTIVTSAVDISIDGDSNISLTLGELSGVDVLQLSDISSSGDTDGIDVIGWLVSQPFLRGIILTMVQDVMNRNLETAEFAFDFESEQLGTEMKLELFPKDVYVINNHADNIGDMIVGMRGTVSTIEQATNIEPALGSYNVQEDLPSEDYSVNNLSSMSTYVNTNMVNQALLSIYNIGITHLTVFGGEVLFGGEVDDADGDDGDFRTTFLPSSPGQFHMIQRPDGESRAYLDYRGAEARVQYKDAGVWKDLALANVNIRAGVSMYVDKGLLYMRMASTPQMIINEMSDVTYERTITSGGSSVTVDAYMNGETVAKIIKSALYYYVPVLTENPMTIDISNAFDGVDIYTEEIDTTTGHLHFEQRVGAP